MDAGVASRIRSIRIVRGLSASSIAQDLEISDAAYDDLEAYDDEIRTSVSIGQIRRLAAILDTKVGVLLGASETRSEGERTSIAQVMERVRRRIRERGCSIDEFSDHIGWDLRRAEVDPATAWEDWNLDCLVKICEELGCDWIRVFMSDDR